MQNTTLNNMLSTTEFKNQLNLNLSDINQVTETLKKAFNIDQLKNLKNSIPSISENNLLNMMQEQIKNVDCVLSNMPNAHIMGKDFMQNTLNASLSTVMGTMTNTMATLQNSLGQIKNLTTQIESIRSMVQEGNIDGIKTKINEGVK